MKPTEIKKTILSLKRKSISNLTVSEMSQINGGLATNPSNTTKNGTSDFPVTLYCYTTGVILTTGTRPLSETC